MTRKHLIFRRLCAALLALALLPAGAWAAEPAQEEPTLEIYTTGDMAGRVGETDPLTGRIEHHSYLKVATAMAQERQNMADTLLLDSGDAVANTLVSGSAADTALALRTIGYDALVPSVEEFRLGQGHRAAFFQELTQAEGTGTPVNVISADWLSGETGQTMYQPYQIFTAQLDGKELRVAVVGLGTLEVPQSMPSYYYPDSQFGHEGNTENTYAWEWTHWVQPQLSKENCDLVVVCCHDDRNGLEQFAAKTTGIDLLVGGHGRADSGTFQNAAGQEVSWVSSGGTALTRTTVTLDDSGEAVVGESQLLDLSDYQPDQTLAKATEAGQKTQEKAADRQAGRLSGDWSEYKTDAVHQSAAADLAAQAMLWTSGADGALVTNGSLGSLPEEVGTGSGIRTLTLGDCASLALGRSAVTVVEMTGAQLKAWLDTCAGRYEVDEYGRITGGYDADFLYGMDYELYVGAPAGQRVTNLTFEGQPVKDDQVFRIVLEESHLWDGEFPACTVLWSAGADMQYASTRGTMASMLATYLGRNGTVTPKRESTWAVYQGTVDSPLTRLEFVEMLYEVAGQPAPGADGAFVDVVGSDAAIWAAETRIVSGDGKGKFLPQTAVTREQAAAMLYNYARAMGLSTAANGQAVNSLSDSSSVSSWARSAVDFCLATGLLEPVGEKGDQFQPAATLSRTEAKETMAVLAQLD